MTRIGHLHALVGERCDGAVGRIGLVLERQPGDAGGRHDRRRRLEHLADEADLELRLPSSLVNCLMPYAGNNVCPVAFRTTLADRYWKSAPGYTFVVVPFGQRVRSRVATVRRMAAAVLNAQQLGGTLVELVVPDGREVDVHQVRRDRDRLVVEQPARQAGWRRCCRRRTPSPGYAPYSACLSLTAFARYAAPPANWP